MRERNTKKETLAEILFGNLFESGHIECYNKNGTKSNYFCVCDSTAQGLNQTADICDGEAIPKGSSWLFSDAVSIKTIQC
jgi:hypothetical protein